MTNFEHYKYEIAKIVEEEKNIFERFKKLEGVTNFMRNEEDASLANMFIEWSIKEYVEPYKLTRFEKDILENIDRNIAVIWKNGQTNMVVADGIDSDYMFMISKAFPKAKFDCLNWDEKYKIADILANCEVID